MVIFFGHFLMVGKGNKLKSMAYVGNIVAFVKFMIENVTEGVSTQLLLCRI